MNHKAIFPDAFDRTPNDPCVLLSAASVRRLYEAKNGADADGWPEFSWDKAENFIAQQAKQHNWDVVEFHGRQVLLKKNLVSVASTINKG